MYDAKGGVDVIIIVHLCEGNVCEGAGICL